MESEHGDIHENLRFWIARLFDAARGVPVIYDIGANDGELTLPFCTGSNGGTVFAFEPLPAARARLEARLRARTGAPVAAAPSASAASGRPAPGLVIVPCALGESPGTATMEVYSDDTFSSLHRRPPRDLEDYDLTVVRTVEVPVCTLDQLCREATPVAVDCLPEAIPRSLPVPVPVPVPVPLPPPDIVKIDVEGAERAVLRGARQTLSEHQPAIVMEYSCINTGNAGYKREELTALLRDLGYRDLYGLYRNRDRNLYIGAALESCRIWNILALPARFSSVVEDLEVRDTLPDSPDATPPVNRRRSRF